MKLPVVTHDKQFKNLSDVLCPDCGHEVACLIAGRLKPDGQFERKTGAKGRRNLPRFCPDCGCELNWAELNKSLREIAGTEYAMAIYEDLEANGVFDMAGEITRSTEIPHIADDAHRLRKELREAAGRLEEKRMHEAGRKLRELADCVQTMEENMLFAWECWAADRQSEK